MRINQTTFCALRILYRIHREEEEVITSKEIAEKEEISQGVTLKILRDLSYAGIVQVYQGRGKICGGFSLAKSIDDITMADILMTLEGMDISVNLDEASCEKAATLLQACDQINEYLRDLFSKYSIRHLFEPDESGDAGCQIKDSVKDRSEMVNLRR